MTVRFGRAALEDWADYGNNHPKSFYVRQFGRLRVEWNERVAMFLYWVEHGDYGRLTGLIGLFR